MTILNTDKIMILNLEKEIEHTIINRYKHENPLVVFNNKCHSILCWFEEKNEIFFILFRHKGYSFHVQKFIALWHFTPYMFQRSPNWKIRSIGYGVAQNITFRKKLLRFQMNSTIYILYIYYVFMLRWTKWYCQFCQFFCAQNGIKMV